MTTTAFATSSTRPVTTTALVGTWKTTVPRSEGNPRPTFEALLTFFADGNMVEVNSMNPAMTMAAHGVWSGAGNSYQAKFETFTFNEHGQSNGRIQAHLLIKMDDPDHLTVTYTADALNLEGQVTKNVVYGPAESTRLKVELP